MIQMLISASWDLQFGNGDWYKLVNKHVNISLLVVKRVICEGAGFWGNLERWEEQGREGEGAAPEAIKISGSVAVSNPAGPSKSRGVWLCPIPPGTLESVVAGVCVARGEGLGFHRHLWWCQLQACWLSGDKVAPVVWWLSSEEES